MKGKQTGSVISFLLEVETGKSCKLSSWKREKKPVRIREHQAVSSESEESLGKKTDDDMVEEEDDNDDDEDEDERLKEKEEEELGIEVNLGDPWREDEPSSMS